MPDPILEEPGRGEAMEATLAARNLRASHQLYLTTENATNFSQRLQWSHLSCFGHNSRYVTYTTVFFKKYHGTIFVNSYIHIHGTHSSEGKLFETTGYNYLHQLTNTH